jgi:hypothetical protein
MAVKVKGGIARGHEPSFPQHTSYGGSLSLVGAEGTPAEADDNAGSAGESQRVTSTWLHPPPSTTLLPLWLYRSTLPPRARSAGLELCVSTGPHKWAD